MLEPFVTVIGAGLAGSEAAFQIARRGVRVRLIDMKPARMTPAHRQTAFGELVCSNSLRAAGLENAIGLLKEELRRLGSELMAIADACQVPAGGALAVDRDLFSGAVTGRLKRHPLIEITEAEVTDLPAEGTVVLATGPLTAGGLFEGIRKTFGMEQLHFFDAAAPVVTLESIDQSIVFRQSRYDKGGADYLNCPMNQSEYEAFWQALVTAERANVHDFDRETVFEGCMPIETMAGRGSDTIRFGPLKPVGLIDPRTGKMPYACVQLRQDDRMGTLYNIVGFQTRLKFSEQRRVFGMIPGLASAEFVRYGVMHRNTFLDSPRHLDAVYQSRQRPGFYFAGQMTGVKGYVESISSGWVAGVNAARFAKGERTPLILPSETVIGSLAHYISDPAILDFQPMNANFGLIAPLKEKIKNKKARNRAYGTRSLALIAAHAAEWTAA